MRGKNRRKLVGIAGMIGILAVSGTVYGREELTLAGSYTIENRTDLTAAHCLLKEASGEEWSENLLVSRRRVELEEDQAYDLKLIGEDGTELIYRNLKLAGMENLRIFEKDGAVYVAYYDPETEKEMDTEEFALVMAPENEPGICYTKTRLNVREQPDTDAEILETLPLAAEITVFGSMADWYLISSGEGYGYVASRYVTDSQEEAERLEAEVRAAEVQAAAEAQAAVQTQTASQQSASSSSGSKNNTKKETEKQTETQAPETQATRQEVSRENVPSCEDGEHGTTYITYSDGSVETIEY